MIQTNEGGLKRKQCDLTAVTEVTAGASQAGISGLEVRAILLNKAKIKSMVQTKLDNSKKY